MNKIAIIGAGEIGGAIGSILQKKGEQVFLWDKDETKIPDQKPLNEIISEAEFVFFCVPSPALRSAVSEIIPFLNKETIVISLPKGIEVGTLKKMDEILEEILPKEQNFGILGGAMLAEELNKGLTGTSILGTEKEETYRAFETLFSNTKIKTEFSNDVKSVAISGILKNIYAFAIGISDGLKWGGNQKGWLSSRCIKEMIDITEILEGNKEIILGSAGVGDFLATGFSPYSTNHQMGKELVKTGKCEKRSEGLISTPLIIAILGEKANDFKILKALGQIIVKGEKSDDVFKNLI
ncbi:MAG: 2-dehydropantoate 2-reductase N-terminal domain-containing protein [Candidatus Paceibacterota bacterium]|jgi:glycerol-3-phosphate dehydrogenase (NAD(P)+)